MTLADLLAAADRDGGRLRARVPDNWRQGRTAYGGLTAALALEAARAMLPDLPPLRSVQIGFAGPVGEAVEARPTLLRRGRNAVYAGVDVVSEAGFGMRATFVFMAARESHIRIEGPSFVPARAAGEGAVVPFPPVFAGNFDYRFAGKKPDRREPDVALWVRLRERAGVDVATELMCIGDALPPAALMVADRLGPISSLNWTVNLLTDAPATRDGWWLLRSTSEHGADGLSSQRMGIWNAHGRPVAEAMQVVGLFV